MSHIEATQFKNRFVSLIVGGQGFPKKQLDRHVLFISATLGLEAHRRYTESELNDELRKWTARFGDAVRLDHVTLRRYLVDEHYIRRDSAGSSYELATTDLPYTVDPPIAVPDLETWVEEGQRLRELKRQQYLGKSTPGTS